MTRPTTTEKATKVNIGTHSSTETNMQIYKKEVFVVISSVLLIMLVSMGVLFMLPFPGLLNVMVWGFPFPYWYQMTISWLGVIVFVYYIVTVLTKIDAQKAKAEEEV